VKDDLRPLCLLLLPRPLEGFILRDQAEDLLRAPGVVAVEPPPVRYGALARAPGSIGRRLAAVQARRLLRSVVRRGDRPAVVVIFHPVQVLLAEALVAATGGDCELWYWQWDRYAEAYDAGPALRRRLTALHERASDAASLTAVVSTELHRLEAAAGREAELVPLAADAFPAVDPVGTVVAVSLGHLGWRTDWTLLRRVAERLGPRLVLLLIGAWHDDECAGDEDYAFCRAHPSLVWLGPRSDQEAARLILCADVGIVPFRREPFNEAALPYRILKYARLGRRTVSPELAGVHTWDEAVTTVADAEGFAGALLAEVGRRAAPDLALREWALAQTASTQNAPLWDRLEALGIVQAA
jgi:hypothetical protein